MMYFSSRALWVGVLMVVAGGLWFVDSYGLLRIDPIWVAALFAVAGLGVGYVGVTDRRAWWASIPAGALLGIAGVVAWTRLTSAPDEWGATLFLVGLGAGFWAVFLTARDRWWAIIPGGVFVTIGVFVGLTTTMPELQAVGVMLFGFALTTGLVAVVPTERGHMRWPLIPAALLAAVAIPFVIQARPVITAYEGIDDYIWPVALLLGGAFLIWRVAAQRRSTPQP